MLLSNLGLMLPKFLKQIFILHSIIVPGRGLSEVVETGRGRRNTGGEVNLDLANTLLTRRRMRRSTVSDEEEEYGDYADYDAEQDYSASNTSYEDTPEVTISLLFLSTVKCSCRQAVQRYLNRPSCLD